MLEQVNQLVSLSGVKMKSLVRWSASLGLMGSVLLGQLLPGMNRAIALPAQDIMKKLESVLVFTITNTEGTPLIASVTNNNEEASIASFFMSQRDAQQFVQKIEQQNPDLAGNTQVVPVSLAKVYELEQANADNPERVEFAFIPVQQQVQFAAEELQQEGQEIPQSNGMPLFNGVPLFYATVGPEQGYLTIEQNGEQLIPIFFNREQLESMLTRVREQQPDLAPSIDVRVSNLEKVIEELENNNDPAVTKIVLVPSTETLEYLQSRPQAEPAQP
ncbi:Tic22 family protein [Laspinema olomoucense]|uniref:Tic22 family protein n=1 Tax=Laspinema olomoucense TaxID=3231600 RepID=UPI0021BB05B2|nr:Tic22 family protein [Laspinema sp. D3a]